MAVLPDQRLPEQPDSRLVSIWSPGDLEQPPVREQVLLASLVRDSVRDFFESLGLITVHQGDDLFISRDGEGVRMLGAIRSTKQCVACHGGERGDLLGAFSYTLQRQQR